MDIPSPLSGLIHSIMALPDDLILEILCLLPLKSGIRCKCLNKSFNKLIPNPKFLRLHGLFPGNKNLFFQLSSADYQYYDMISLNPPHMKSIQYIDALPIMSSANSGRLLLQFSDVDTSFGIFIGDYCLFNPVTGAYVMITYPWPQPSGSKLRVALGGLVDDFSSPHYKLVTILHQDNHRDILDGVILRLCIFESDRNSWRERTYEMEDIPPVRHFILSGCASRPVFVNGCLHWLLYDGYSSGHTLLLVFDARNEVPSIIKGPHLPDQCNSTELGNGPGSSVAILASYMEGKIGKHRIYVLDNVQKKWQPQMIIDDIIPETGPLYFDEEILICLVGDAIHAYKMRENVWEKCGDLERMDFVQCFHRFVPALVSIPDCRYIQSSEETHNKLQKYYGLHSLLTLQSLLLTGNFNFD